MTDLKTKAISGIGPYRRLARNLEPELKKLIQEKLQEVGRKTEAAMKANTPSKTGDLRDSIAMVTSGDELAVAVGPGIRGATLLRKRNSPPETTKADRKDLLQMYKMYWLEYGTKTGVRAHHIVQSTRDAVFPAFAAEIEDTVVEAVRRSRKV